MHELDYKVEQDFLALAKQLDKQLNQIAGDWNGDEPGKLEDRATSVYKIKELLNEIIEEMKQL